MHRAGRYKLVTPHKRVQIDMIEESLRFAGVERVEKVGDGQAGGQAWGR